MNMIVLNGSPKSKNSFTMQYVHFIQKIFPQHTIKIIDISQRIASIEKDGSIFQNIINEIEKVDCIMWAFSVHFFLVPSQYKRFVELIFERNVKHVFKNKFTAVLITSIHYFDHTAEDYMHSICDDLEMRYLGAFTPDMYDLLKEDERKKLSLFMQGILGFIKNDVPVSKKYDFLRPAQFTYTAGLTKDKIDICNKKMLILSDVEHPENNLCTMIKKFKDCFANDIKTVDIKHINIKGGCLGCMRCGPDNICAYENIDGFIQFYDNEVKPADIIIFAGSIKDRYLSARWKLFFDRSFFNTHIATLAGKQIGFIVSGPLRQMPNVREILSAYAEWQQANLVDFITDEAMNSAEIDKLLQNFAKRIAWFVEKNYVGPNTFLGIGGMKVFRDDTWGRFRFILQANHNFFKKRGLYDFPQNSFKIKTVNALMMTLTKIPVLRKIFRTSIEDMMVRPLKVIVNKELKR